VQITAKTDYAVRSLLMLAHATPELVKLDVLIAEQQMPRRFVEAILSELRRAGLVRSQRGSDGGYGLALPAEEITLGQVIRIVDGPIADGPGARPHELSRIGVAEHLPDVWVAMWASLRSVLDQTTLEHVLSGRLPEHVARLSRPTDAGTALSTRGARA
jgi:Rrf2 family protein